MYLHVVHELIYWTPTVNTPLGRVGGIFEQSVKATLLTVQDKSSNSTNPFNLGGINSNYHDVHDMMPDQFRKTRFQYNVLHLNIQGLTFKFNKLNKLLSQISEAHVEIDDILLCETFLNDDSAHLFELPNYNMVYKKQNYYI